ncbi:MAG: metallophosphoesterase [Candidatus Omnitrophica bacterium]|nr:metallophosphoesterase [Candidatus Omnitrophota bacterium]
MGIVRVTEEENVLSGIRDIVVMGDPGCSGLDGNASRVYGTLLGTPGDIFIVNGDIVRMGTEEEYSEFSRFTGCATAKPVYCSRGNHDMRDYDRFFGLHNYIILSGAFAAAVLDTASRVFEPKALDFLGAMLDKHRDKRFIVLFHIPPKNELTGRGIADEEWAKLKRVMDPHMGRIDCVITGHIHAYYQYELDGYRIFISGGAGAELDEVGSPEARVFHALKIAVRDGKPSGVDVVKA